MSGKYDNTIKAGNVSKLNTHEVYARPKLRKMNSRDAGIATSGLLVNARTHSWSQTHAVVYGYGK